MSFRRQRNKTSGFEKGDEQKMETMTLKEIISAVHGSYGYPADTAVTEISTDTRTISKGSVFVALAGANFDGHDYAAKAMELGAEAVITERPVEGARCIIVDSTRKALLDAAGYYRSKFDIKLVGITGSVGKTTTKDMIACVLSQSFKTLKTQANFNNEIGMPKTLFGLDKSFEAAVIEMGMNHPGEISRMSMSAQPDAAVITNIGVSHIENLGSQENILKAKLEILDGAKYNAPLILSRDDKLLYSLKDKSSGRPIMYYSLNKKDCDVYASDVKLSSEGVSFDINYMGEKLRAELQCPGEHNVRNALAAFCVGVTLGMETDKIIAGLAEFKPEGLRQNIVRKDGITYIVDCYNAAPDSMKAALSLLASSDTKGRRFCLLADMLELGKNTRTYHKNVGEMVPSSKADRLYTFGENSQFYIDGAVKKGFPADACERFESRKAMAERLSEELKEGDCVLLKGSRGMKLEEVFKALTEKS